MASAPSQNGIAEIVALANLILSSVTELVEKYQFMPVELLGSSQTTPAKVEKVIRTIEAACAQLSFTVASPGHVMLNRCYGPPDGVLPRLQLDLDAFSLKGLLEHTNVLPWRLCGEHAPHSRALSLHMPKNATAQTLVTISKYLHRLDGRLISLMLDLHPSLYLQYASVQQRNVGLLELDRLTGLLRRLRVAHGMYFHPGAATCRAFGGIMDIVPRACRTNQLEELAFDVDITYPDGWFSGSVTALKGVWRIPWLG
ncbi:hypothetical protein DFH09DRAFT_1362421 [Mycena vulgaris]|nr:hypothetical protein DFH09DRAFT_1362421 [Mycena vulgaris]